MKKYMVRLFSLLVVVAMAVSACNPDTPENEGTDDGSGNENVTPGDKPGEGEGNTDVVFPEKVVANVTPGEVVTLTFEAATKWEVSVPAETSAWFSIVDGKNTTLSLRGTETGTQEVQIQVRNIVDYRQAHTCEVSLNMGNRTEVIAQLTLPAAQREIDVYEAEFNETDNVFQMDSLSKYVYSESTVESVKMRWVNGLFRQKIAVDANFNWSLVGEIPAWLELSNTSGENGRTEISLNTVPEELPLEPTVVKFDLCDYSDLSNPVVVESFTIDYDGCKDVFKLDMNYQLRFNTIGDYYDPVHAMDFVAAPAAGTITAPKGVVFYTFVERNGKLYHDRYAMWINFTVADYPEGADEKGLYTRAMSLTVNANTELTERKAYLMALPASVASTITDPANQLYADEEHTTVAYDLRDYIFGEIEQLPYVPPGVIDATNISTMRAYNADFEELENASFITGAWAGITHAYRLSYSQADTGDYLTFNVPFSSYEVYGYNGQSDKFESLDGCWISLSAHAENENCYKVMMDDKKNTKPGPDGQNVAYLVFYGEDKAAYAVVECVLDENFVAPPIYEVDTSAVAFLGEESFGETLEFLTPSDPDWNAEAAVSYPGLIQVRVVHRSAMSSLRGMKFPEFTTWRSTQDWLKIAYNAGLPCVDMQALTGNKGRGVITLYNGDTAVVIIVCVFGYMG
ncbi:MAG: hypothetical protein J6K81_04420 [Rikenellaceae bacterium]|nr:hypothetical protein [Rikenellaceae bacterium]